MAACTAASAALACSSSLTRASLALRSSSSSRWSRPTSRRSWRFLRPAPSCRTRPASSAQAAPNAAATSEITATEVSRSQPKKRMGTIWAFCKAKTATTVANAKAATRRSCMAIAPSLRYSSRTRSSPLSEAARTPDGKDQADAEDAGDHVAQRSEDRHVEDERPSLRLDDQRRADDQGADDHGEGDAVAHDVDPVNEPVEPPVAEVHLQLSPVQPVQRPIHRHGQPGQELGVIRESPCRPPRQPLRVQPGADQLLGKGLCHLEHVKAGIQEL